MNNEHKEALQQLLQGANVNIHQLVVGDSTQTIENLIMGDKAGADGTSRSQD